MNRRELLGCWAAAILVGCSRDRVETPDTQLPESASIEGSLATVRGESHPLDPRAAAVLLGPTRNLHRALSAHVDLPDASIDEITLLCDASRRMAAVEWAAEGLADADGAWRAHYGRMTRLRDQLQASMGTGNVTRIHVHLADYEATWGEARHLRDPHARAWADARMLADDVLLGFHQRMEADEPLNVRFVDSFCMASWRVCEANMGSAADAQDRAAAATAHLRRLLRIGDDHLGDILDAYLGPQLTVAAYHLRLAGNVATASGVPAGTVPEPRNQPGLLGVSAVEACTRTLADWTERFEGDEPVTPAFAREGCRWSARLAAAVAAADPANAADALRRHAKGLNALLTALEKRGSTAERGDAAQKAVIRHAVAEAEVGLNQRK